MATTTQILLAVVFDTVATAVLLLAFVRGGRPERVGGLINLFGLVASTLFRLLAPSVNWAPGAASILAVDICVAAGFFWLGVTTVRFWPIWAAGFALADLFMSICAALLPHVSLFAYHTGLGIYAYLALGALALGTFRLAPHAEPHIRIGSRRLWLRHLEETS
jgi:hypothetical protein